MIIKAAARLAKITTEIEKSHIALKCLTHLGANNVLGYFDEWIQATSVDANLGGQNFLLN